MEKYPEPVSRKCTKIIFDQMNESIYKINIKGKKYVLGFFLFMKYNNKKIPILISNNDIINKIHNNKIDIINNNTNKTIELEKIINEDKKNRIVIIEIKEEAINDINFLEIDDRLYEKEGEFYYSKESIYLINYNNKFKDFSVSYGLIKEIKNSKIIYSSNKQLNNNFSLIFNLSNNKIIGLHNSSNSYYNKGILFKEIINRIINIYSRTIEIHIIIDIQNCTYNEKVYFLNNCEEKNKGSNKYEPIIISLKYLNSLNTILYINDKKYEYKRYFIPNKIGKYYIKLKLFFDFTYFQAMFSGCDKINSINFINFNKTRVIDMSSMFKNCKNLKNLNILSLNTNDVKSMNHMFEGCESLTNLDLSSFNTKNVIDMSYMFCNCKYLEQLDFYSFDTKNVMNMSNMFNGCKNLKQLNLSSFNTKKVLYINNMFYNCEKLECLNISSFNIKYVEDMENLFYNCKNLTNLNSYSFKAMNVKHMNNMFYGCENIRELDLSNFKTNYIKNMSKIFYNCKNLKILNLSSFDTKEVNDMNGMFYECKNLKMLDLSNFNTEKVKNMSNMFYGCSNLTDLDLSSFNSDNVENMDKMFYDCKNFIYKDLSSFFLTDFNNYRNEFFIEFIDEDNFLINKIKTIKLYDENGYIISNRNKLFIMKKKNKNKNKLFNPSLILNLIDANSQTENKNYKADCIVLVYNANNKKSLENIEILWLNNKINKNENNLIYLIGINYETKDKILTLEAENFFDLNKIKHINISGNDDNAFINLLNEFVNLRKVRYIKSRHKILILGDNCVGKTSLIKRIENNQFIEGTSLNTIGIDFIKKKINLNNGMETELLFADTSGIKRLRKIIFDQGFIRDCDCLILMYDIMERQTYDEAVNSLYKIIINEYKNIKLIYIVGNKIDEENKRQITNAEAKEFADEHGLYFFEISCKDGIGIDKFFEHLCNEITKIE